MNNKKITWVAFGLLVILQLWIPASVIKGRENVMASGKAFKFRTAPRDPNDYFRGKYIFLNFNVTSVEIKDGQEWKYGQKIFVSIASDSAGYAKVTGVSSIDKKPSGDYIEATVNYLSGDSVKLLNIEWPFERFYMEESKAPLAEEAYNATRVDSSIISYALVKVKNGTAVLKNVFIDNKPVDTYIKK
jgi:uncharacterized membrane-anchored protein